MTPHVNDNDRLTVLKTVLQELFTSESKLTDLMNQMDKWLLSNERVLDRSDANCNLNALQDEVFRDIPLEKTLICSNRIQIQTNFLVGYDHLEDYWYPKLALTVQHDDGHGFDHISKSKGYVILVTPNEISNLFYEGNLHIEINPLASYPRAIHPLFELSDDAYLDTLTALQLVAESY